MNDTKITNLVEKLDWSKLPFEVQDDLVEKTGESVFKSIMVRIIESLSEEDKETFVEILEAGEVDELVLNNFIVEKVPNADELVSQEVEKFLKETNDVMDQI
ncbi:hypothetical protein GW764_03140 [Candidatus Parcubacteria bacterium]|nr:hypothetical protein [Candidatus Parcubacteria bacterium]